MIKKDFGGYEIQLLQGDIARLPQADGIVNAANAQLTMGGGVAGAIHSAAGTDLDRECREYAPIKPGEAVITGAHKLPNKYVIHCLGPIYGRDKPENQLLANCYKNALRLADENRIQTLAFPAISTGAFGYPIKPATEIAVSTVRREMRKLTYPKTVIFVLFSNRDFAHYKDKLETIGGRVPQMNGC